MRTALAESSHLNRLHQGPKTKNGVSTTNFAVPESPMLVNLKHSVSDKKDREDMRPHAQAVEVGWAGGLKERCEKKGKCSG